MCCNICSRRPLSSSIVIIIMTPPFHGTKQVGYQSARRHQSLVLEAVRSLVTTVHKALIYARSADSVYGRGQRGVPGTPAR